MISKKNRFTQKNFEFLRRKMRNFRSGDFLFLYGNGYGQTRFAVVISKKIEKFAVNRNKLKRQIYEFFRKEGLTQSVGFNVICLYKGTKIPKNTAEFSMHLIKFLKFLNQK